MARDKIFDNNSDLVNAVFDLINKKGKEILTIRTLSRALNISSMTLYNYISDIHELRKSVELQGFALMSKRIRQELHKLPENATLTEKLYTMGMTLFEFTSENPEIFRLMITTEQISDVTKDRVSERKESLRDYLDQDLNSIETDKVDIIDAVALFNLLKMGRNNAFSREIYEENLNRTLEIIF